MGPQGSAGCRGVGAVWGLLESHPTSHLSRADVVPTPPDGPPTVASVTGRAITLTWNKPKWLDTAIGEGQGVGIAVTQ